MANGIRNLITPFFSVLASSGCDQVIYGQGTVPGVHERLAHIVRPGSEETTFIILQKFLSYSYYVLYEKGRVRVG